MNDNETEEKQNASENTVTEQTAQDVAIQEEPKEEKSEKKTRKRKGYFYEEEEKAFVDYINSTDKFERDKLFKEKLMPAFTKMIESIIRRYNLFTPSEDFSDTFYDTLSFLITKVNNFDVTKGYKVYSYCGTVCKNYLILKRTQDMKHTERNFSYEKYYSDPEKDRIDKDYNKEIVETNQGLMAEAAERIRYSIENEKDKFNENDIKVGYALIDLLENWEEIFERVETAKFNKTSVLWFVRETTMLSSKEVRDAMKKFKLLYFDVKNEYFED